LGPDRPVGDRGMRIFSHLKFECDGAGVPVERARNVELRRTRMQNAVVHSEVSNCAYRNIHIGVITEARENGMQRMAPLDGVAVAANDHNLYAVLGRKPEESFADLLQRLDKAVAIAQKECPLRTKSTTV